MYRLRSGLVLGAALLTLSVVLLLDRSGNGLNVVRGGGRCGLRVDRLLRSLLRLPAELCRGLVHLHVLVAERRDDAGDHGPEALHQAVEVILAPNLTSLTKKELGL